MARSSGTRGIIRSAFDALVEARSRQAERYVNGALLMLDDQTLRTRGIDRESLLKRSSPFPY